MRLTIGVLSKLLEHGQCVTGMLEGSNTQGTIDRLKKVIEDPAQLQALRSNLRLLQIYLTRLGEAELE